LGRRWGSTCRRRGSRRQDRDQGAEESMDWVFGSGPGSFGIWGRIFGGSAEIYRIIIATIERLM
jgi:hypothetical protein